ncbi:hypothetical protein BDP81DRAFT_426307 [Colletotrichum phormii]|uniref:Cyclochlorotine biosynthesis protein O n=1 Tax=Colletotrichum phormii TaxID=359342 RepID=A0AAI9ZWR3_9PEZI|nr:uncharacterized protein BDP81DRAFT_426307 [Colletotrichum phormii]KAK1637997.1 hypothetical protein BDP81DRAFT_426307 [Colletotrichum phormii]
MGRNHKEYAPVYSDESAASSLEAVEATVATAKIRHTAKLRRFGAWTLHVVLITIYTAIFAISLLPNRSFSGVFSLIDAPPKAVGEETHLEVFPIQGPPHGKYTGEPRPEVDKAWRDLLQYNNIRVSEEWVHRWGREHEAVKLPDGGYLGMLSVFHELHCIKRLYQTLSPDYYFPNATEQEIATNREHNQHCLEVLRMGAACRGDISIITHMWTDIDAKPIVNQTAPHQCIDFNKVMDYSRDNTVDVYQDNYIVHPKFGPSFPKGNSIKPFKEQGMGHHH